MPEKYEPDDGPISHVALERLRETIDLGSKPRTIRSSLLPLSFEDATRQAERAKAEWSRTMSELFNVIYTLDREFGAVCFEVFGRTDTAMHWLTTPLPNLGGDSPLRAVLRGDRLAVLDILGRMQHSVLTQETWT